MFRSGLQEFRMWVTVGVAVLLLGLFRQDELTAKLLIGFVAATLLRLVALCWSDDL